MQIKLTAAEIAFEVAYRRGYEDRAHGAEDPDTQDDMVPEYRDAYWQGWCAHNG